MPQRVGTAFGGGVHQQFPQQASDRERGKESLVWIGRIALIE